MALNCSLVERLNAMSIKKIIIQCIKYLVRIAATPLDAYRLSKMSRSDDTAVANFAKVLRLSFSRKPDPAGVENIRHIEEHRQRLLVCNTRGTRGASRGCDKQGRCSTSDS